MLIINAINCRCNHRLDHHDVEYMNKFTYIKKTERAPMKCIAKKTTSPTAERTISPFLPSAYSITSGKSNKPSLIFPSSQEHPAELTDRWKSRRDN